MSEEKITYNACQGWMCHEACVLTTYSKDGRIVRTERTVDPHTGEELTGICQKGIECAKLPYIDGRLQYPLKRVGERGEGKFERISWDQAMDEIGAKLNEIRDKYGPESVLLYNYCCGLANPFANLNFLLSIRFVNTFGASLLPYPPVDLFAVHPLQVALGTWLDYVQCDVRLFSKAKQIIIWGGNPIGFTRAAETSRLLMEAQDKGTKITDIGIIFDSTAAKSDEFIPINPGTDGALALSMVNVMLAEGLWDADFVSQYTVGPFLVRDDNGKFLRESEIIEGGDPQKYVYWNKVPIGPRTVAPYERISEKDSPDLFAEVVINGIPCKTAMCHIRELVEPWTPEAQKKITGVPAETARRLVHEYVQTPNSMIYQYYGPRYLNAGYIGRAVMLVAVLSGQMKNETGGYAVAGVMGGEHPVALNSFEVTFPDGDPQKAKGKAPLALSDMIREGFPYKALLNVVGNPMQNWPNRDMWVKDIYPKLDLIVVYEYRMTDTAKFADYVLPDTTPFEREEILVPRKGKAILLEQAIEPVEEAKPPVYFYNELAKRVGLTDYFNKTNEEWIKIMLKTDDPAITTLDQPLTLERLRKEKVVQLNIPQTEHNVWESMDFHSDSGRIEFYSEHLADVGAAVPIYVDPLIRGPERKKYPLQLLVFRSRVSMQTQFSDFPELLQIVGKKPEVEMNPSDAQARGISNGDLVEVFNDRGSFKCRVKLTAALPPGMAKVLFFYPAHMWEGDPPQKLMFPMATPEMDDPVIRKWVNVLREKSPMLTIDFNSQCGTGWENLWDNYCDIRKV
jgi:molybdopterin-containing oxidoreductase family molybdopterin binding subunit